MSLIEPKPPAAWEPLTPRGVAAFARARWWRLFVVQVVVAAVAAGWTGWFLEQECFPIVRLAIRHLPETGEIRRQQLNWPGGNPVKLAGNHFLGFGVDLDHSGQLARESQVQVEFGRREARILAAPFVFNVAYPAGWRMAFNRAEVDAWWGAWEPALEPAAVTAVFIGLLVSWTLLATLYCVPVRLITLYENRDLNWRQSWRMAGAALMPGALFLTFGMVFYGMTSMALAQLGVVWALHFVIGWIYLFVSPVFLPREPAAPTAGNPFKGQEKPAKK